MATKKTPKKSDPKPKKAVKAPKAAKVAKTEAAAPRHPHGRLAAAHGSKEALAKSLASALAREDEDNGVIAERLGKASNQQLLRLQHVVATVKDKDGSRSKLIAALGAASNKSKDKDYLTKLDTYSLPQLLDLAKAHERRAHA